MAVDLNKLFDGAARGGAVGVIGAALSMLGGTLTTNEPPPEPAPAAVERPAEDIVVRAYPERNGNAKDADWLDVSPASRGVRSLGLGEAGGAEAGPESPGGRRTY